MGKRGFSLLEMLCVLFLLALLALLGAGAFNRYRANTALVQGSQRLSAEMTNTLTTARTSGQIQVRGGVELGTTTLTAVNVDQSGVIGVRILEGSIGQDNVARIRQIRQMKILEDPERKFRLTCSNLALTPLVNGDTGLVLEVGTLQPNGAFTPLLSIPFNPDGTVLLPRDDQPGRIVLDNGNYRRQVEISRAGKIKESRL